MNALDEKNLTQISNIVDTLIEATEHLSQLVKAKELTQSIYIFSSMVDGVTAICQSLPEQYADDKQAIEKIILLMAQEIEQNQFLKVSEMIQFTLMPRLRGLKKQINQNHSNNQQTISIGVFLNHISPRKVYSKDRIKALVDEANQQETELFFFSSENVDFDQEVINGEYYIDGTWQTKVFPYPSVIINIGMSSRLNQSHTERKLRRLIPFTSFGLENKFYLPKRILENKKFADLLVFFKVIQNEDTIFDFFNEYNQAVIKPIVGRQGQRIYFVEKQEDSFILKDHTKSEKLDRGQFSSWIKQNIPMDKYSFLIQRYVNARTKDNEPYDIRAHVQKNADGKWQITKIYPRIGNKKSILSNISRGGRTLDLDAFLVEEFGSQKGKAHAAKLKELSLNLTHHLDKIYGFALDELGLDLAIDQNQSYWIHEVNNGPQSTYHEKERAVNSIGYAKYIAANGIYITNQSQRQKYFAGQFNARSSQLEIANLTDRTTVGMLVAKEEMNELAIACAYVANFEQVNFFCFGPEDIDFDEMQIRGHFYQDNEWVAKIVEYPDVVYDRLRLRGVKKYNVIYEEFEEIPVTNEFFGNSINKLEVYNKLNDAGVINQHIIPYQQVQKTRDVFHYLNKYGAVILKPEVGSFARGVHLIEKQTTDQYLLVEGENQEQYNEFALSNYLRTLLKKGSFIVQKYISTRTKEGNPFDIRVHLMKDGSGNWSFVKRYPRIGFNYATISAMSNGGYIGTLDGFIKRNFSIKPDLLLDQIDELSLIVAKMFESFYSHDFNELALDIAIDSESNLYLIEVNTNKPGIVYIEFEVARLVIPYCIFLAQTADKNSVVEH